MKEKLRIAVYFGNYDRDLILLLMQVMQGNLADMVRLAFRYYLGKTNEKIPLPPVVPIPHRTTTSISLYYDNEDDKELIEFLLSIKKGFRSTVIKRLLRYAMEQCDLRSFAQDDVIAGPYLEGQTMSTANGASSYHNYFTSSAAGGTAPDRNDFECYVTLKGTSETLDFIKKHFPS